MDSFELTIDGRLFYIETGLHAGFYTVSSEDKSAMLGKNPNGDWEFSLQSSESINLPAQQIGAEIERVISATNP